MALDLDKLSAVLVDRGKTHGDFHDQAAISQQIKSILAHGPRPLLALQKEALEMIAVKMSRIVSGDPNEIDHWLDIAGYAKLVSDIIGRNKK